MCDLAPLVVVVAPSILVVLSPPSLFPGLPYLQERVPTEVLVHIFSFLRERELTRVIMVCRRFREVGELPSLWFVTSPLSLSLPPSSSPDNLPKLVLSTGGICFTESSRWIPPTPPPLQTQSLPPQSKISDGENSLR